VELRDRIHALNEALTDPTDPRYQQLDNLLNSIDPARGMNADQLNTLQQLEREQLGVDAANEQRINDFFAPHREAFEQRVAQLQSEERAWQQQQQDESDAASLLNQIKDIARRHGYAEILDRTYFDPNFLTGDDGHLNVDNVRALQAALHNELAIDRAMPPAVNVLEEGTIGTLNTMVDVARSMPVRLIAGIASGGQSELAYQTIDALEAIHNDVNASYDKGDRYGQSYSVTDALRTGSGVLAHENLPINNLENLARLARGEDVGVSDFLKGGVMDVLAAMGTQHSVESIAESVNALQYARNPAEVASALNTGENLYKGMIDRLQRIGDMGFGEGQPGGGQGLNAHTAPPGTTLTPNLANQMGIRDPALRQVQVVADRYGAAVEVRETTALAPDKPIGPAPTEGYQPKAGYVLTKTVNEADGFIGGPGKDHLGEAGFFNPEYNSRAELPPHEELVRQVREQYPEYSNDRVNAIAAEIPGRLDARIKELGDAGQGMYEHEGLPRDQGGIDVRDGVVYPAGHDYPFVGDHDLYRIQVADTTGYKIPPAGRPDAPVSEWVTKSVDDLKQQAADAGRDWNPNNPSGMTDSAGNPVGAIPVQEYTNAAQAYGGSTKQAIVDDLKQPPYRAQHGAHVDFEADSPRSTPDEPSKFEKDLSTGGKINIATRDKYLPGNPNGDNLIRVEAGPAPPTLVKDTEWQTQRPKEVQRAFDAYTAAGNTPRDAQGNVITDPQQWKPPPTATPAADAPHAAEPPMPPGTEGGPRWYGTVGMLGDDDRDRHHKPTGST
jgi:hypothetical protein